MDVQTLKTKGKLTRTDIADLLRSIGKPSEKQDEKKAAVAELGLTNPAALGGHPLHETLETYSEY